MSNRTTGTQTNFCWLCKKRFCQFAAVALNWQRHFSNRIRFTWLQRKFSPFELIRVIRLNIGNVPESCNQLKFLWNDSLMILSRHRSATDPFTIRCCCSRVPVCFLVSTHSRSNAICIIIIAPIREMIMQNCRRTDYNKNVNDETEHYNCRYECILYVLIDNFNYMRRRKNGFLHVDSLSLPLSTSGCQQRENISADGYTLDRMKWMEVAEECCAVCLAHNKRKLYALFVPNVCTCLLSIWLCRMWMRADSVHAAMIMITTMTNEHNRTHGNPSAQDKRVPQNKIVAHKVISVVSGAIHTSMHSN